MQLKLLNFHKIISKFSSYIVEAFIALIVYQATQSFAWALLYMVAFNLLKFVFTLLLKKYIQQKPQLFLLIRIIPFMIYSTSILLFETPQKILGIILVLIFESISSAINETALDCILNYSAYDKSTSATGLSRVFEYGGVVLAILLGGAFLDHLDRWVVIVIACSSYFLSVIPLFIYYLKQRKERGFNKEPISNAAENFKKLPLKKIQQQVITKKILIRYFLIHCAMCVFESLVCVFCLYLFKMSKESYSLSSYVQISYYTALSLGSYIGGLLDEKLDLTKTAIIASIINGIAVCLIPLLIKYIWAEIILFFVIGFLYAIINIFVYSRMVTRSKILGVSNSAITNRMQGMRVSQMVVYAFCSINPVMFIPTFILIGVVSMSCAYFIPKNEERTRKMLVDYLQNNKMY